MSPRPKANKAQIKLVTRLGARSASQMAPMGGDVRSRHSGSLRPDATSLDADAVLFLIGKNKDGFWVAREEHGCAGGRFFTERGALQFARRWASPLGCTTMRVSEPLELDFKGEGDTFIPLFAALKSARRAPAPVSDVMSIVLGLAAVAIAVWLTVILLTLGR